MQFDVVDLLILSDERVEDDMDVIPVRVGQRSPNCKTGNVNS
jgi:hypothetical protein